MTNLPWCSVALYVHVWRCDDLPGIGDKLGWIDGHSILLGSLRVGNVPRM